MQSNLLYSRPDSCMPLHAAAAAPPPAPKPVVVVASHHGHTNSTGSSSAGGGALEPQVEKQLDAVVSAGLLQREDFNDRIMAALRGMQVCAYSNVVGPSAPNQGSAIVALGGLLH